MSSLAAMASGYGVRLARASTGDGHGPFVILHEGRTARLHLAEIVNEVGEVCSRFVWKLRLDRESAPAHALDRPRSAADRDAMWAREDAELARVVDPHVVARFPVPAAMSASLPVAYCRRTDRYFTPVSPTSGRPLSTCRDEGLLRACGLPPPGRERVRYLHDGVPGEKRFFAAEVGEPIAAADGTIVSGITQLVAGWRELRRGDGVAADTAAHWLPCVDCAHRAECYPVAAPAAALPALREVHFVSFHDVQALALQWHAFDYHEACALLGGDAIDGVSSRRGGVRRGDDVPAATRAALGEGQQWLFPGDPARMALEMTWRKLSLFLDVCAGVAAVHATGRPHLAVAPANVVVGFEPRATGPARWQLRAVLGDLGSAQIAPIGAIESGAGTTAAFGPWLEPGAEMRDDPTCRAFLDPSLQGRELATATMPVACWQTGAPDGLVRFVVEAQGPGIGKALRSGDLAVVQSTAGGPTLVARVEEVRPRGLLATALLPKADPCLLWDGRQFQAHLAFHRHLGPAADLPSLGMLLLSTLLVDDAQGLDEVTEAMGKCLRRLADEPTGVRVEERSALARLTQLLASKEHKGRLDSIHVIHRHADREAWALRAAQGQAPVDPVVWYRLLAVAARLLAVGQPFAYAASLGDAATAALAQAVAELTAVRRRLEVDLFRAGDRDEAVCNACAEVSEELARGDAAGVAAGLEGALRTDAGFRLLLSRDGDPAAQELRYAVPRVTIGRREGENLLRLNDPMVSSAHAMIEATPEGFVVIDRNSTNGTEVDGVRLPVEVPQPLQEGSVIVIRPFRLVFHGLLPVAEPDAVADHSAAALLERLREAFAAQALATPVQIQEAMLGALASARNSLDPATMRDRLAEVRAAVRPAAEVLADDSARAMGAAALRAFEQLSRSLLGSAEFVGVEQVQVFAGKLGRFADATTAGIERLLELRKVLGKHLELGASSTGGGRSGVRTAAEIRDLLLGWASGAHATDTSGFWLAKFFDDLLAIVAGLLEGNQQIRRAVRERLEPDRLVEAAGREAKLRLLVQAAAGSALWKTYVQAFHEVTGGQPDESVAVLLQRLVQDRRPS